MKYLSKLLVVALCLVCGAAQAQTFVVSGQVVDSKTRKPIEFATVQLLNSSNKMVTGMNTDAKGRFVLKTKAAGKYTAKASYVTYKSMEKSVTLSAERDSVDLGLYELVASEVSLNTAVVSATVARVEQKEDTMVYNASAYRTPEGSTLDALVEQLPGVEVSDDGTITWNGKTVTEFLINGKDFFKGDTKIAMKNLPVELVSKLKAYDKIAVKSGEKREAVLSVGLDAFAYWSIATDSWRVDDGVYEILIGASSRDIRLTIKVKIESGKICLVDKKEQA